VSTTSTNCIWHRRTSTTAGPRRAASKDQRHLRALPPHHSGRVLRDGLSQEALHQLEGTADGSRCLARRAIGHVRTQASTVTARLRCRPSWTRFLWRGRKCLTVTFLRAGAGAEPCTAERGRRRGQRVRPVELQPRCPIKSELLHIKVRAALGSTAPNFVGRTLPDYFHN
jgi:hypothetical protein